jgi:hypothetical protein
VKGSVKGLLSFTVTVVGALLVLQVVSPLYVFVRGLEDGVELSVYESSGRVVVELAYNIDVPLEDARLVVEASGAVYESRDPVLTAGEVLRVEVPAEDAGNIEALTVEGRVAGIYYVSITLRGGQG